MLIFFKQNMHNKYCFFGELPCQRALTKIISITHRQNCQLSSDTGFLREIEVISPDFGQSKFQSQYQLQKKYNFLPWFTDQECQMLDWNWNLCAEFCTYKSILLAFAKIGDLIIEFCI